MPIDAIHPAVARRIFAGLDAQRSGHPHALARLIQTDADLTPEQRAAVERLEAAAAIVKALARPLAYFPPQAANAA